ncbi:uncharacterized protein LOC141850425 [Brevipalpus obovatus]|uniref:uncharacterized protein LOC141850425 n=1 Tax=Brevipalpus obovatus TaxID=246614 RepID=UPI003D9E67EA
MNYGSLITFPIVLIVFISSSNSENNVKPSIPIPPPKVINVWPRPGYIPKETNYHYTPEIVAQRAYDTLHGSSNFINRLRSSVSNAMRFVPPFLPLKNVHDSSSTIQPPQIDPPSKINSSVVSRSSSTIQSNSNEQSARESDFFESLKLNNKDQGILTDIYVDVAKTGPEKEEQFKQMSEWMSRKSVPKKKIDSTNSTKQSEAVPELIAIVAQKMLPKISESSGGARQKNSPTIINVSQPEPLISEHHPVATRLDIEPNPNSNHQIDFEDDDELPEENGAELTGGMKPPSCGQNGRHYCTFKEDYPIKTVIEVTRYYKWPLEKLFRDLRSQVMPKLANDNYGGLVCDSITRVVRPGWARNTNNRWLVIINTEHYQQYVTEVVCRHGQGSRCNFVAPCYHATCKQRYNTQKLLVVDPGNPYKGPFLSEFLFPSCCICHIAGDEDPISHSSSSPFKISYKGPYPKDSDDDL